MEQSDDPGAVFDAHVRAEFAARDIDATTHIPVLTGGCGRDDVRRFYSTNFIGHWPADTQLKPISRTIGQGRVIDEFILTFTHDREMPAMLPGVPPTGRKVELPHVVVMGIENGTVVYGHIYWDQGSLLTQVGLLDPAKLPVSGAEQARKLLDPTLPSKVLIHRTEPRKAHEPKPQDTAELRQVTGMFSDLVIAQIAESLSEPVCERRRELLPKILHEWSSYLRMHLSRDSRAVVRARIKKIERVIKYANELSQALKAIDKLARVIIEDEILRREEGHDRSNLRRRMDEENDLLTKIAAIAPNKLWNLKRGHPRNIAAYLVLQDAAAIFEWYTGEKPTREVDRRTSKEIGPFFRFASALWPVVFGKGVYGLPAAMKNWEWARSHSEESALIANINMRHRAWGVYEC